MSTSKKLGGKIGRVIYNENDSVDFRVDKNFACRSCLQDKMLYMFMLHGSIANTYELIPILKIVVARVWTIVKDLLPTKAGENVLVRGRLHTSRGTGKICTY